MVLVIQISDQFLSIINPCRIDEQIIGQRNTILHSLNHSFRNKRFWFYLD